MGEASYDFILFVRLATNWVRLWDWQRPAYVAEVQAHTNRRQQDLLADVKGIPWCFEIQQIISVSQEVVSL